MYGSSSRFMPVKDTWSVKYDNNKGIKKETGVYALPRFFLVVRNEWADVSGDLLVSESCLSFRFCSPSLLHEGKGCCGDVSSIYSVGITKMLLVLCRVRKATRGISQKNPARYQSPLFHPFISSPPSFTFFITSHLSYNSFHICFVLN